MTKIEPLKPLHKAMRASQVGDTEGAVRLLEAAIAQAPADPLPHFLLAAELAQAGMKSEAEAAYAKTVLLAPQFATARFQLGLLQYTSGRVAMAFFTWQSLLELPDTNAFHHFVLGFAALAQDRFGDAVRHLQQGILLNQDNAPLNADISNVLHHIEPLASAAAKPTEPSQDDMVQASHHVLLANYQQDGLAH